MDLSRIGRGRVPSSNQTPLPYKTVFPTQEANPPSLRKMTAQYDTELAANLQAVVVTNYVDYALATLVFYDYILTVAQEIRVVWRRSWSLPAILLVLNRYTIVFNAVLSLLIDLTWGRSSCNILQRLSEATIIATYIFLALFASVRIYALWEKNIYLSGIVFSLNIIPAITNIVYFTKVRPQPYVVWPVIAQCNLKFLMSPKVTTQIVRATRIPMIIADALVMFLTWRKTFEACRSVRGVSHFVSFHKLLLRDGTVYFFLLLVLNMCQLILASTGISPIAPFIYTLTPILTSRFMLNLRQEDEDCRSASSNAHSASSLFADSRIMGNMGNALSFNWSDDDMDAILDTRALMSDSPGKV